MIMMMEEVFSSDDSSVAPSEPSCLITDEDFSDALFHNCDVLKTGKVEVSALIELLRFSTDQVPEVQNEIGELAKLLDPEDTNPEVDIESYRLIMAEWIQSIKDQSESSADYIDIEDDTPVASEKKTSTPIKDGSPLLNMMACIDGAGDGFTESNELQEKIEDLQFQNQRLVKEVSTLRSYLESSEEALANKTSQIENLSKDLRAAQHDSMKLKQLEVEFQEIKSNLAATETARQQAHIDLSHAQKDKASFEQKVTEAEEEVYQISVKLEEMKKANNSLLDLLRSEKIKLESSRHKQDLLEKQLSEDRCKMDELLTTVEDINKINEKLKTERSELKVQLTETRNALEKVVLQANLGVEMMQGSDEEDEPMPLNIQPSIASEIKSRLGCLPQMPLPLCGKDYEEVFEGGDGSPSLRTSEVSSLDTEMADIMKTSRHIALLPTHVEEIAAYMEKRKEEVMERMTRLTGPGSTGSDTATPIPDPHTRHQAEMARFAEKIAAIYTAKLVSDKKLAKLTNALQTIKAQQGDVEARHQRALEEIQASSASIQEALLGQVEQLQQEKMRLEETVSTLVRRCSMVSELLTEKQRLQEQIHQLESANADLTENYKKAEDLMNDSDDELDKNKKDKKETQKTQTTFDEMASADSIRVQISMEIQTLRSQLARSQATLAALQSKGLPLTRTTHHQDSADWKQDRNQQHSPSTPLIGYSLKPHRKQRPRGFSHDALTLDFNDALPNSGGDKVSRRKEGCISADSILDGNHDPDYDGNGNLEYDQGKLLANSCPHLSSQRAGLVTSGTQTDCPEYVKPRPPAIGATKYAVVNTSTGSSTSGVVDLDISSGSNKSEPHGVIKKSVLIVETACSPDTLPSSPEDPYDPLCRYRTSSFKRAIERGPSGDSSNQSFETADPASTSPDLTPDRPYLPPFPAVPGARDPCHLQPPPYREPSPDSKYSGLSSGHHSAGHPQGSSGHHRHHGDAHNVSTCSSSSRDYSTGTTTSSSGTGTRDTSTDTSWSSPGVKEQSSDSEHHHRKFRSSTPENCSIEIQEASPTTATPAEAGNSTATGSAAATQDGRQSPQFLRRLSTLIEEGSDAEAEESLLSPKMRSGVLSQPGRRPPRLLDVPSVGSKPVPPPQYKNPPGYQEALQAKRDTSPRSEHRNSPLESKQLESSVYQPLDQAEPPTSLTPLVSPKAVKPDRSPVSPGSLGMPFKRTIFPPPRTALSPSRENVSPSIPEPREEEKSEMRPAGARQGSRRGVFQETHKTRDALYTIDKDGEKVDLVSGNLEEVELSEEDKLRNAQLLEEARKTSTESRHKSRRLRKGIGSDLTRGQTFDDGEGEDLDDVFKSGSCPSTSAATPTDHAPLSPHVTSQQSPLASRELGIVEVHSPMYPEDERENYPLSLIPVPSPSPSTPFSPSSLSSPSTPSSPKTPLPPPRRPKHSRVKASHIAKTDTTFCDEPAQRPSISSVSTESRASTRTSTTSPLLSPNIQTSRRTSHVSLGQRTPTRRPSSTQSHLSPPPSPSPSTRPSSPHRSASTQPQSKSGDQRKDVDFKSPSTIRKSSNSPKPKKRIAPSRPPSRPKYLPTTTPARPAPPGLRVIPPVPQSRKPNKAAPSPDNSTECIALQVDQKDTSSVRHTAICSQDVKKAVRKKSFVEMAPSQRVPPHSSSNDISVGIETRPTKKKIQNFVIYDDTHNHPGYESRPKCIVDERKEKNPSKGQYIVSGDLNKIYLGDVDNSLPTPDVPPPEIIDTPDKCSRSQDSEDINHSSNTSIPDPLWGERAKEESDKEDLGTPQVKVTMSIPAVVPRVPSPNELNHEKNMSLSRGIGDNSESNLTDNQGRSCSPSPPISPSKVGEESRPTQSAAADSAMGNRIGKGPNSIPKKTEEKSCQPKVINDNFRPADPERSKSGVVNSGHDAHGGVEVVEDQEEAGSGNVEERTQASSLECDSNASGTSMSIKEDEMTSLKHVKNPSRDNMGDGSPEQDKNLTNLAPTTIVANTGDDKFPGNINDTTSALKKSRGVSEDERSVESEGVDQTKQSVGSEGQKITNVCSEKSDPKKGHIDTHNGIDIDVTTIDSSNDNNTFIHDELDRKSIENSTREIKSHAKENVKNESNNVGVNDGTIKGEKNTLGKNSVIDAIQNGKPPGEQPEPTDMNEKRQDVAACGDKHGITCSIADQRKGHVPLVSQKGPGITPNRANVSDTIIADKGAGQSEDNKTVNELHSKDNQGITAGRETEDESAQNKYDTLSSKEDIADEKKEDAKGNTTEVVSGNEKEHIKSEKSSPKNVMNENSDHLQKKKEDQPCPKEDGSDKSDIKESSSKSTNQRPSTLIPSGGEQANKPFRTNVPLSKIREENLAKKRSLTKQSTMPELAETVESDTPTSSVTPASGADRPEAMNHHSEDHNRSPGGFPPPGSAIRDGTSPMTAATAAANSAFPSLPDDTLKHLGLFRQKGDTLQLGDQFTDQEIEEKFASLALAFKTDKLTLEKRIDLHERARDIAEQNVNREIDGLKEAMKTLSPFCTDAQSRDIYSKVQHHVEVLEQSTSRVSSRAEVHGAVQQELRMSKAIEVMVNHVENLKRLYDKEHQELEETKKLLTENKVIGQNADGDGLQKRSYSLAGGGGLKLGGRRRASVAVFPRKLSMLGAGSSSPAPDHPMDPKTRFQTLIADTAMKTSVVEQLRRSVSIDHQPVRPSSLVDLKSNTGVSKSDDNKVSATSSVVRETGGKGGKANLDSNSNIDQEAAFQKGYEEGIRAKMGAELCDLRLQQRAFYDSLENLIDQNEVSDEEEKKLGPSWVEVVWQMWPGWSASGQRLRLAIAGFIFMLAFLSLVMTLIPVSHASERRLIPISWTSLDEFFKSYSQVRHYPGGPPV